VYAAHCISDLISLAFENARRVTTYLVLGSAINSYKRIDSALLMIFKGFSGSHPADSRTLQVWIETKR
jgi:hypothetical protein